MTLSLDPSSAHSAVTGRGLAAKLDWLYRNAESGSAYIIKVNADESIAPHQRLEYAGQENIRITIKGVGSQRIISLLSEGSMFIVDSGVTLILDTNIIIRGRRDNRVSLVRVNTGGTLVMNNGSAISGNTSYESGGAVFVSGGATFAMYGGEISGNAADDGGAVYVDGSGTFAMHGGIISGCSAIYEGGGVYVDEGGTFAMYGGSVSGNASSSSGGGVRVDGGIFTMSGGIISHNRAGAGMVFVDRGGVFTMSGGEIRGRQEAPPCGGHAQSGEKVTL